MSFLKKSPLGENISPKMLAVHNFASFLKLKNCFIINHKENEKVSFITRCSFQRITFLLR